MAGVWTRIGTRSMQVVQALTETPADADLGVLLEDVDAIVVVLHAPGGQTFTGVGRLLGYIWTGSLWVQQTRGDIDMADAAGKPDWSIALGVDSSRGKCQLVPSGVTLSGAGSTITTEYLCTTKPFRGRPA